MATNAGEGFLQFFVDLGKVLLRGGRKDLQRIGDGGILGSVAGKYLGTNLTGSEREANAFTTAEREAAQQWSEDMYVKYQSPEAQISSQMQGFKDNGINPALMYGGSAPQGGSLPSSDGGQSVSPSSGAGILSTLLDYLRVTNDFKIAKERNDIEDRRVAAIEALNPSRIEANYASAWRNITAGNLNDIDAQSRSDMNSARIALMYSQVDLNYNQSLLAKSGINVNVAKAGLMTVQAVNQEIANNYAERYWKAELALKEAMTEGEWTKVKYLNEEISYITSAALKSAYESDLISRYIDEKDIDIDMKQFLHSKQSVDWLFDKGIQTMNMISNGVTAGASLGRTVHYGRSVTAGIGEAAGRTSASVIAPVFNPAVDSWFGN